MCAISTIYFTKDTLNFPAKTEGCVGRTFHKKSFANFYSQMYCMKYHENFPYLSVRIYLRTAEGAGAVRGYKRLSTNYHEYVSPGIQNPGGRAPGE